MKSKNQKKRMHKSSVDKQADMKKQTLREQSMKQPVFGFIDEIEWEQAEDFAGQEKPTAEAFPGFVGDSWDEDWIFGGLELDEEPAPDGVEKTKSGGGKKKKPFHHEESAREEAEFFGFSDRPVESQTEVEEYPPSFDEESQLHLAKQGKKSRRKHKPKNGHKKKARE
ncbi:hypothetical protein [Laceyella putida]|uniref:Uncharacterized protein n=1 Tax=Laceyella putida TaxID=110101 RepID=A0ABW2RN78_9BACL